MQKGGVIEPAKNHEFNSTILVVLQRNEALTIWIGNITTSLAQWSTTWISCWERTMWITVF